MPEFTYWLKANIFHQIKDIINENINENLLNTQLSKSNTANNFYQTIFEDYISHYISHITKKLHDNLIQTAKEETNFFTDSRRCPKQIQSTMGFNH
jgi:hypothetical protein